MTEQTPKKGQVKKFAKSFVNVRRWIFYDEIVNNGKVIVNLGKRVLLREKKPITKETFEEAVERLQLSNLDLANKEKHFLHFSITYSVISLFLLVYAVYLFFATPAIIVACVVLIIAALMLLYAYRENFWFMQLRKRKLGCNFKDWVEFMSHRGQV